MSRFDDCYDEDFPNQAALYQANTERALKGKRGKAFLRELEAALLTLSEKRLIEGRVCEEGQVCAMGALALKRKVDSGMQVKEALEWLEAEAPEEGYADETGRFMEKHFGIMERLSIHAAYVNDEYGAYGRQTAEERYGKVLKWVQEELAR